MSVCTLYVQPISFYKLRNIINRNSEKTYSSLNDFFLLLFANMLYIFRPVCVRACIASLFDGGPVASEPEYFIIQQQNQIRDTTKKLLDNLCVYIHVISMCSVLFYSLLLLCVCCVI